MAANVFIIIAVSLFFSAFFSGLEIAYLTANQMRIELKSKKGILTSRILSFFIKHPSHFFTTTLVGNNIAVVMYSIYAAGLISWLIGTYTHIGLEHKNLILLIQTVVSSFFMLIIGEFLPKAFFRSRPNFLLN